MAFEYSVLNKIMLEINAVGGFDKILQLKIVQGGTKILYLQDALVFDEKVDSSHAFKQQRKRWVSSQFIYLKQFFIPAFKQLLKGNVSYFNLAIANNLVLPRAFLLLLTPLAVLITYFVDPLLLPVAFGMWFAYLLCLFLALPQELVNKDLVVAIAKLPKAIIVMAGTLFQMKKANKTFIHTVHTKTEINNPLFNEHS
jgi:cellulose synthase/poly-beta-1,6-N-acetylglucosamine synthase-like glycosyltransferase